MVAHAWGVGGKEEKVHLAHGADRNVCYCSAVLFKKVEICSCYQFILVLTRFSSNAI